MSRQALEIEKERARERRASRTDMTSGSIEPEVQFGRATEIVAKKIGLSRVSFERAVTVINSAAHKG
jgi:hypothetical protein